MLLVIKEFTDIDVASKLTVCIFKSALTIFLVILPITRILTAMSMFNRAFTSKFTVHKFSKVFNIDCHIDTDSMCLIL